MANKSNGRDEPQDGPPAGPVVVAQVIINPGRREVGIVPGPMVNDHLAFYTSISAAAAVKAAELLQVERANAESRKKPQILRPSSWPSDLKGRPNQ